MVSQADDFNPRTPCGVRRGEAHCGQRSRAHFNPRTPCGVRPPVLSRMATAMSYFNPRTPCGVRPCASRRREVRPIFQSTHPVRGATTRRPTRPAFSAAFQSTHPVRGATIAFTPYHAFAPISIHAPRAGCDMQSELMQTSPCYFNPRTPCGVRLWILFANSSPRGFQSTHPVRGATNKSAYDIAKDLISIHAPRAGCDVSHRSYEFSNNEFQSTHPVRGATVWGRTEA